MSNWHVRIKLVCLPEISRHLDRRNLKIGPPSEFIAVAMQVSVMVAAQWHGEFVTDLAPEGSWLRKF